MKTICLLTNQWDTDWITGYWRSNSHVEDITIIAPSFDGRLIADSLHLPYKTYEEQAWKIDKKGLSDVARIQSHYWHQIEEMKGNPHLEAMRMFKNYPLFAMHQGSFAQVMSEILQSYHFMRKVLEREKPDKVIVGKHQNPFSAEARPPFNMSILSILTSSNGLEREALKALSTNYGIEFIEMSTKLPTRHTSALVPNNMKAEAQCTWNSELAGPKVLIFTWGGYYLKQLSEPFDILIENKARIGLVIVGDRLTPDEKRSFKQNGIFTFYKSHWPVTDEQTILDTWRKRGREAYKSISESKALKNYFSGCSGTYFSGLVNEAIKSDLVNNIPFTVIELLRSEAIINTFEPDLVFTHFAFHPWESCDALPARLLGIPTLTINHGVPGYTNSVSDTFSTQYYAVMGDIYKDALIQSKKCSDEAIIPVGESRLEKVRSNMNVREAKKAFGFNSDQPLCIFCDSSGWSQTAVFRHATFKTVQQLLYLKKQIPDLQIIYRVHHGASCSLMQQFFQYLNIPGVVFQISPNPLFTDIVQAADVVISHHTSAISEALVSGVPVIYLCALSEIEPNYLNCRAITVANKFEILPELVKNVIENPMTREDIRTMAQPYFDRTLCGNDGKATERLAQLMLKLARIPKTRWKKGFEDWLHRIDASCEFKSGSWNIGSYGRSNMISSRPQETRNLANRYNISSNDYMGHNLVFIVGCPRSGTTWVQRLLSCHPKIRSGQESDVFDMFIGPQLRAWRSVVNYKLSGRPVGLSCYFREKDYLAVLRKYMMDLLEPMIGKLRQDKIFVEKTPSHALYIPEIMEMLPESRVIHVLRDVRDVVASLLSASKSWGKHWAPKDARSAAQMWVQHVRAVRESAGKISKAQFYELRYEDMSVMPEDVLSDLCLFLGLEWNEGGIRKAVANNELEIAKKTGGTIIPIKGELASMLGPITKEPEGFVRKGQPGSWEEDLSENEVLLVSQIARNTMDEVGYQWDISPKDSQNNRENNNFMGNDWYITTKMGPNSISNRSDIISIKTMINKLRDEENLDKAVLAADEAVQKHPESLDLLNLKAKLKVQTGNIQEGKKIFLGIIKRSPGHVDALNNLGVIEFHEGNLNSAIEFLKDALLLDPANESAIFNLSHIQKIQENGITP